MVTMDAWEAVVEALKLEEVPLLFGLPGNPRHLYQALYKEPSIRPILVRHQTSGAFMAMAYARLTGKVGVCHGSSGPGAANLVPGILEAWSGCIPLIALSNAASQATEGMGAFQEVDQVSLFRPITKWSVRIPRPEKTPWVMRRAFHLARTGKPGPVFVEVPGDVAFAKAEMEDYVTAEEPIRTQADPARLSAAVRHLIDSRRPILIAGGGAMASRASVALADLAELMGLPVFTTPGGRGILPEDHPQVVGLVGLYRTKLGEELQQDADLVLSVGARNEEFQSGAWLYYPPGARFIQIDIDPDEIGRNWVPQVALVGDARLVLEELAARLRASGRIGTLEVQARRKALAEAKAAYEAVVAAECRDDSVPLKTKRILWELNEVYGRDTVLVNENGSQDVWSYFWPYYKVLDIGHCVPPAEQTCMGLGVAGAIGAKLAWPHKKVVCVTGDGAFQMYMKELPTAAQYRAPVTWVVLNNRSLGWCKYIEKELGGWYVAVDFEVQPDFVAVAEACGCLGRRVEQPEQIRPALEEALQATRQGRPAVLDFVVDPWDLAQGFLDFHRNVRGIRPEP